MTSKEIIVHVDKKGLEAIFETNDFSNSLFFYALETNPKLSQALIIKENHIFHLSYTHNMELEQLPRIETKLLLTHKRNQIK